MSRYGFRVYSLNLRLGRTLENQDWVKDSWTGVQWFESSADMLKDQLVEADLKLSAAEALHSLPTVTDTYSRTRYIRLLSVERHDRRLALRLRYGMGSDFSHAMGAHGDEPLGNRAPGREYRVELLTPEKDGAALLAVESIAGSCPGGPIIQWLGAASRLKRPDAESPWHRLVGGQVVDPAYLQELIAKADEAQVTLRHRSVDGVGNRERTEYRLEAPLSSVNQRGKAVDWAKQGSRGLTGMLEIVGITDSGDFNFNDGYMLLNDGDSRTRVGLSGARETFTYPTGDIEPSLNDWLSAARGRFEIIDPQLGWTD